MYAKISVYSEISTKSGDFFTYDYLHATIDDHYFVERRCADSFLYCFAGGIAESDSSKYPASRRKN
ncbi:hypothetical protein GAO43_13265 [Bacteroides thetaiotaomicron]|uniref:Uncharacterized protein n=1 Tax=Bacteroides thetaiotaomicron TaxID=818 RepID=A0A3E5H474_BACT4|nr:hypothetical protein GAO47_06030 [Bacteroides thetaiotaomicron]KAB4275640.1 hypothetical protein GAO40_04375 [Bacteroides thetaiotaomicron]KAB4280012.1 hypothetical protein GAO35_10665 [Bacteroides thetaiotaomicron]KAB4286329.1 hypothetical protein GAO48_11415 [Bacteroides thetaiotaomicron]KAB4288229.1 hypothetical protein GAO45_14510 [Bacteroides thetaiotaomicron]